MVSRIAFGGIPIERVSTDDAVKVIRRAIELGINFIDTANGYTDSEEKIGLAIKGIPRDRLVLTTKSPVTDKKTFMQHLDLSLKRLGTDYIDIYQHHNISSPERYDAFMCEGGAYEGMLEAIRSGKVRFPGFSSHDLDVAIKIMRDGKFDVVQLGFNYVEDEAAEVAIPLAGELDMGFLAMKPFGGGLLSDAKLSIKFLAQFESIVPDPGMGTLAELEEIIAIHEAGEPFNDNDAAEIEKAKLQMVDTWCHRCEYCQPCPQGIEISNVLAVEKNIKRLPFGRAMRFSEESMRVAGGCTKCGDCVPRCPYRLNIPELIEEKLEKWNRYLVENR